MDLRQIAKKKTLFGELKAIENTPLDSKILTGLGFTLVNYVDLDEYKSIEELCTQPIILFTPVETAYDGHYSCLFLLDGNLMYWCSYGYGIKKTITLSKYLMNNSPDKMSLINLVNDFITRTGGRFIENNVRFQSLENHMSTCGRYSICRVIKSEMSHEEFNYWFNKRPAGMDNDQLISAITYLV